MWMTNSHEHKEYMIVCFLLKNNYRWFKFWCNSNGKRPGY